MGKKKISIVTSCYNEAGNIQEFYDRVIQTMKGHSLYDYEIIVADNLSTDGSRDVLRKIAAHDRNFKVILNSNNFGPARSGYNAFLHASGDAAILMSSDLQDPPELIHQFIAKWEEGYLVVVSVKKQSEENFLLFSLRRFYYWLLSRCSAPGCIIKDFNGFGLYDRKFLNALKQYNDPVPYFRGFVSEIGFRRAEVEFTGKKRKKGRSSYNFLTMCDLVVSGFVNHSKLPLRLATFFGFCLAGMSLCVAIGYLIYKLLYWDTFSLGLAPMVIGMFFLFSMQLFFMGIIGEYVGAILTQTKNRPLIVEEEKINFDEP